ncbi:Uncharacterised protein [uncultured archaeon]|nr:Uncharacterised protein [uncultured archaeon]
MLETPQERVQLLKAGIDGAAIEKLYLICNNFKIIRAPLLFEQVEGYTIKKNNSLIGRVHNLPKGNMYLPEDPHVDGIREDFQANRKMCGFYSPCF